jgi:hypothetical protein
MAKLGRDGRVSKHALTRVIPPHNGMRFKDSLDGTHYVGITPTQAAHTLDDEKQVHKPTVGKKGLAQVHTRDAQALRGPNRAEACAHEEKCDLGDSRWSYGKK